MSEKTWEDSAFIRMKEDHLRNEDKWEEEQLDFIEQEEIKERLYEFLTKYREEKETNKKLLEEGEMMETRMKELEEDNKSLTINLDKLNKEWKKMFNRWKEEEEKTLQHEEEQKKIREQNEKCEDERVKIKEKENENLREENENLIQEVEYQRTKNSNEVHMFRKTEWEYKKTLQELQDVLQIKAEEIEKLSRVLAHKHEEEGEHKMFIEEFRKEIRGIKNYLSDIQEVEILEAATVQNPRDKTKKDNQKKERDEKKEKDRKDGKTQRSWRCPIVTFLWIGAILAGIISIGIVLVVNIMASNVPDSTSKVQIPWHLLRHSNSDPFLC